jgi:hypothetical protein
MPERRAAGAMSDSWLERGDDLLELAPGYDPGSGRYECPVLPKRTSVRAETVRLERNTSRCDIG